MFTDEWGPGAEDDVEDEEADVPGQWASGPWAGKPVVRLLRGTRQLTEG